MQDFISQLISLNCPKLDFHRWIWIFFNTNIGDCPPLSFYNDMCEEKGSIFSRCPRAHLEFLRKRTNSGDSTDPCKQKWYECLSSLNLTTDVRHYEQPPRCTEIMPHLIGTALEQQPRPSRTWVPAGGVTYRTYGEGWGMKATKCGDFTWHDIFLNFIFFGRKYGTYVIYSWSSCSFAENTQWRTKSIGKRGIRL